MFAIGNIHAADNFTYGYTAYDYSSDSECTEEYTQGENGDPLFQEWNVSLSSRLTSGPFGRRYLSDEWHAIKLDTIYVQTCTYVSDDGARETFSLTEYQGEIVGVNESTVTMYIDYDNSTNLPVYEITLEIPDKRGETERMRMTVNQTFYGTFEGYGDGYIPTAEGRNVHYRMQVDLFSSKN